ncbi:MAG: pyruvate, phosphate dikinase [Deltaproteobacteria bacterium]|jgi:pyruvate,water dikinase|nr:MAG: pyruvate, phosphate dikinase [Deltaproteobacteria bacterium]
MLNLFNFFKKEDACTLLTPLEGKQAERYRHFRELLKNNYLALHLIADLEEACYGGKPFTLHWVRMKYQKLFEAISNIISSFEGLSKKDISSLIRARDVIGNAINEEFRPEFEFLSKDIVIPFDALTSAEMKKMTGSKAGNLALIRNVLGLPVPDGFVVTAYAFQKFMDANGLNEPVAEALEEMSVESGEEIERVSRKIIDMIMQSPVPSEIEEALINAYAALEQKTVPGVHIAVRSSAIGEDTEASFAGQYSTELNVTKDHIIHAYKTVIASKYSARAISYRTHYGLDDRETPMCVAGIVMLNPKASGVLYTKNPTEPFSDAVKINAVLGLGEYLVDGSASPDVFVADKKRNIILEKHIGSKEFRMVNLSGGGIDLEKIPESERQIPAIDDSILFQLRDFGLKLEEYFGNPQDVEWAVDKNGKLFILQSRPLNITDTKASEEKIEVNEAEYPVLISSGKAASPGVAIGNVFIVAPDIALKDIPAYSILVAKTASPSYAEAIGRLRGIITDMGSTTSHLASVAREFGVPMLADTKNATSVLANQDTVTFYADITKVWQGAVQSLEKHVKPAKRPMFESPVYQKTRKILDHITPLHLTDPKSPSFTPEGCNSIHDIIRFTHEESMKQMFSFGETTGKGMTSVKLTANLPMFFYLIDIGGGLKFGLSTCDVVTPDSVESIPFKAVWKGFTHPGITWSGAINLSMGNFMTLMASGATAGEMPGATPSYVLIAQDYMNMSARFGYHFATIDTLCTEDSNQNYITLQFSGGVGTYYRRSLRINFLGNVLKRLGFEVSLKGDLLDAALMRYDKAATEEKLDQLARLLACSRLLDMAISGQEQVGEMAESFFRQEYNFLERKQENDPKELYVHTGFWKTVKEKDHIRCIQDGAKWGNALTSGVSKLMGKMFGDSYQEFLDNIDAYHYFPFAIAKNSEISDGSASVLVNAASGSIDRAGGLAFGIKDVCNYFVFRINALEDNVILFEFDKCKRYQRKSFKKKINAGEWYLLKVEITGNTFKGFVNDELLMEYEAQRTLSGYIGLWTKADSVTHFENLQIQSEQTVRTIEF